MGITPLLGTRSLQGREGICDPNKKCYAVYDWNAASNDLAGLEKLFLAKDSINDLVKFSRWNDAVALNAVRGKEEEETRVEVYLAPIAGRLVPSCAIPFCLQLSKAAAIKMALYQHMAFMGGTAGINGTYTVH